MLSTFYTGLQPTNYTNDQWDKKSYIRDDYINIEIEKDINSSRHLTHCVNTVFDSAEQY